MFDKFNERFDIVRTAIIAVALIVAYILGLKASESGGYVFDGKTYGFIAAIAAIFALAFWAHKAKGYWQELIVIIVTLGLAGFISSKVGGLNDIGKQEFAQSLRGAGLIVLLFVVSFALTYRKRSSNKPAESPDKEAPSDKKSKKSKKQEGDDGFDLLPGQHEGNSDSTNKPPVAFEPASL